MCVVSMIYDHYQDRWGKRLPTVPSWPGPGPAPFRQLTDEEIEEFRQLLEQAREYDKRTNQPDCELDEKRKALKEIARQLGVEIAFL